MAEKFSDPASNLVPGSMFTKYLIIFKTIIRVMSFSEKAFWSYTSSGVRIGDLVIRVVLIIYIISNIHNVSCK